MSSDDGLLSQEDIDALTAGLFGGMDFGDSAAETPSASASSSTGFDPESIRPVLRLMSEQTSGVITTVLSKNVEIKTENLGFGSESELSPVEMANGLIIRNSFENDISGKLYWIISKNTTASLADLMMMGDGASPFEEDHKDALKELINQVMGATNTTMTQEFETALSIGQADVQEYGSHDFNFDFSDCAMATLTLKVNGLSDSTIRLLYDGSFIKSFLARIAGKQEATAESLMAVQQNSITIEDDNSSHGMMSSAPNSGPSPMFGQNGPGNGGIFESTGNRALDMLLDIPLNLTIELGRTKMSIRRILEMGPGSVIEMDRFAGEPVDLLINNKVVARGEVVVVDENFGIRVVSLVTPEERLKFLK